MKLTILKKTFLKAVTVVSFIVLVCILQSKVTFATTDPVRIWDYDDDEHRLNATLVVSNTTGNTIGYKLEGITEKSHEWTIDDSSIITIDEKTNGRLSITGAKEGMTRLRLSVKASDGKTYNDYAVVNVYTPIENADGKTSKKTLASRSAHSGSDNRNERASLPAGTKVNIYGKCGAYYRVSATYDFDDGLNNNRAYVLAKDINVPINKITLSDTSIKIQANDSAQITASVGPAYASNKTVKWESSSDKTATVDNNGIIKAKRKGTTTITAKSTDGAVSASCKVEVYVQTPEAATKAAKAKKPVLSGKATSLTSVTLNVKCD